MSLDEGVYLCGKPDCSVCWLYGERTPAWEARARAEFGAALIDSRPTAVRLAEHPAPTLTPPFVPGASRP